MTVKSRRCDIGKTQTKELWASHLIRPQRQYGSHMTRNNAVSRARRCWCWYPQTQVWNAEKSNYPELTGATNSGLPQKRQSPCPWPRKSPLESIAASKLWGERKKERERYLKPAALWSLSTCCRLSDSLASLAQNCSTTRKLLHSFSFLRSHTPCNLRALFQQIGVSHSLHSWPRHHVKSGVKQCFCGVWITWGLGRHSSAYGHNSITAMWIRWQPKNPLCLIHK